MSQPTRTDHIVELQSFIEFGDNWYSPENLKSPSRANMVFEPITLNLDYVAWVRRYIVFFGKIELTEVSMVDHGKTFRVDKTYEEMRELLGRK